MGVAELVRVRFLLESLKNRSLTTSATFNVVRRDRTSSGPLGVTFNARSNSQKATINQSHRVPQVFAAILALSSAS